MGARPVKKEKTKYKIFINQPLDQQNIRRPILAFVSKPRNHLTPLDIRTALWQDEITAEDEGSYKFAALFC